jgi:hypothetical protein
MYNSKKKDDKLLKDNKKPNKPPINPPTQSMNQPHNINNKTRINSATNNNQKKI